jgi:hypothetical protein
VRRGSPILKLVALALGVAAFVLAACGGGGGSGTTASSGPDPASLVPADSPLYFDSVVKPAGDQRAAVDSFLQKISGRSDVGSLIVQSFDKQLQKSGVNYEKDIAPWLGERLGAFATKLGKSPGGAAIVPTTDPGAAMTTFEKAARATPADGKLEKSSYKGTDYDVQGNTSFGVVGDFFVAGTDDAFKAAVDTAAGGASLASSSSYRSALAGAPADRLATVVADPKSIVDAILASSNVQLPASAPGLEQLHALEGQPVAAWLDATSSTVGLTVSTAATGNAPASGASLITGFPDDAWLAFGASMFGQGFAQGLQQLQSAAAAAPGGLGGPGPAQMLQRLGAVTGVDFKNLTQWLGSASGYMSGSSVFSLGGALVLGTSDEQASARTLSQVQSALAHDRNLVVSPLGGGQTGFKVQPTGAPVEIDVEQSAGKVVVGLGQASIDNALHPSSSLGDSSAFKAATGALGSDVVPSFYLDFKTIASFLALAQSSSSAPGLQQAMPYLDRLDYLVAGAGTSGDRQQVSIVLGVHEASGSGSGVTAAIQP